MSHTKSHSGGAPRYEKFCKFCCDAGKSEEVFTSHFLRESTAAGAKVVCPTLLDMECRYCHEAGHTIRYCPKLATTSRKQTSIQTSTDGDGWSSSKSRKRNITAPRIVFDTDTKMVKKVDTIPTTSRSTCGNRFAVLLMEEDEPTSTTNDFPSLTRGDTSFTTAPTRIRDTKKSVWKKPPTISVVTPPTPRSKKVKKTVTFQGPPLPTQAHTVPLEKQLAQMLATSSDQIDRDRMQKEKEEPVDTPANVCISWGDGCGGGEYGEKGAELDWGDLCVD